MKYFMVLVSFFVGTHNFSEAYAKDAISTKKKLELKVDAFQVRIQKVKNLEHKISSWKKKQKISEISFERFPAGAEVKKMELVKGSNSAIAIDYFKGTSGSTHLKDCYDIILFQINKNGELIQTDKLEYRCDSEEEGESFRKQYEITVGKDGKAKIIQN